MLDPTGHLYRSPFRLRLTLAILGSLALHSLVVLELLPELMANPETQRLRTLECPDLCRDQAEPERISYELMVLPPAPQPETAAAPPLDEETPAEEPLAEEQPDEEEEPSPPEPLPETYYMVDLQTREEDEPPIEETPYLAPVNMRTDEEVQAEDTTLLEVDPGDERAEASPAEKPLPEPDDEALDEQDEAEMLEHLPVEALAFAEDPEEPDAPEAETSEQLAALPNSSAPDPNRPRAGDGPALDLSAFNPSLLAYQRSPIARDDRRNRERIARQMHYQGYLHHDDEVEWERMRASLENMVPEVRTGSETRLNARRHEYAEYLSYVHRRIHALWADDYLMSLDLRFDPTDRLSNPDLQTTLELVIDATGEIVRVNIVSTSGYTLYDGEAIAVVHRIGPLRPPPTALVSENGNAYIHWNFWRDQRQCGTFGASVHRIR